MLLPGNKHYLEVVRRLDVVTVVVETVDGGLVELTKSLQSSQSQMQRWHCCWVIMQNLVPGRIVLWPLL